jgi:hypothetical protein
MMKSVILGGLAAGAMAVAGAAWQMDGGDASRANAAAAAPAPTAKMAIRPAVIGANLGMISQFTSIWPFADVIQSSGGLAVDAGAWVPIDGRISLDATGHPVNVPAGTTLVASIQGGRPLPPGPLSCRISPGWRIEVFGGVPMRRKDDTHFELSTQDAPTATGISLKLRPTGATASLTDLSCRLPGLAPDAMFNPAFVNEIRQFPVIRFMDWMRPNNAPAQSWATRPTPAFFTQQYGVALEYMVALSNQAKVDPWFTVPLDADDTYYRNFAVFVRDHLDADRKVYVELSNEVWNTGFKQARDAEARGLAAGLSTNQREAADRYYAKRVKALMAIWSDVFAGQRQRLVRVAASQAVLPWSSETILGYEDTAKSVDALAVAPYFYNPAGQVSESMNADQVVSAVFNGGKAAVDTAIRNALRQKAVANKYGLRLIAYEGGQHYTAYTPKLGAAFILANRDQRMEALYADYLRRWRTEIGDLMVLYNLSGTFSQYGSWGLREYTGQPLADAPKMRAVANEIKTINGASASPR